MKMGIRQLRRSAPEQPENRYLRQNTLQLCSRHLFVNWRCSWTTRDRQMSGLLEDSSSSVMSGRRRNRQFVYASSKIGVGKGRGGARHTWRSMPDRTQTERDNEHENNFDSLNDAATRIYVKRNNFSAYRVSLRS